MQKRQSLPEPASPETLAFGPFRLDPAQGILRRDGKELILPPRAAVVLRRLLQSAGEVVSKEALLDAGWNGLAVSEQSLTEAIAVLRRSLGDNPLAPAYIQTVHRRGYRFVARVEADGGGRLTELVTPPAVPVLNRARAILWASLAGLTLAAIAYVATREPSREVLLPRVTLLDRGAAMSSSSLSPDGTRLAYVTWAGELMLRDLATKQDRKLADSFAYQTLPPVWSRDGRRVAYTHTLLSPREWEIRSIDLREGDPTIHYRSAREPALVCDWSPDGKTFLFMSPSHSGSGRLLELSLADGKTKGIALGSWDWPPRASYSPDGGRIVYALKEEDRSKVYITRSEDGKTSSVSTDDAHDSFPLWSPDGRLLLFRSARDSSSDLWVEEIEGLNAVRGPFLVKENAGEAVPISWSANGGLLYTETSFRGELYRLPVDPETREVRGEPVILTERFEEAPDEGVPSRSGDRIAASAQTEGGKRFFLLSGGDARPLSAPTHFQRGSVIGWAPDDSWVLLWGRTANGEDSFLRVYPARGDFEKVPLGSGPPLMGHFGALSPDGGEMVLEQGGYDCERELVLVSLGDGERRRLGLRGCRLMSAWSPDGKSLAVARNTVDETSELLLLRPASGSHELLASWANDGFGTIGPPAWSPDGRTILFVLHRTRRNELFAVSSTGGTPWLFYQPRMRLDPWKPFWRADGGAILVTGGGVETRTFLASDLQLAP